MKKILYVIFTLLIISSTLSACASESSDADITVADSESSLTLTSEETSDNTCEPSLPQIDMNGEDFTFCIVERDAPAYAEKYIYTEGENGEIINDSIYARNLAVAEKFNTKINVKEYDDPVAEMRKLISSGDTSVDAISAHMYNLGNLALEGYLVNLNNLPYVDFNAEYWDTNSANQLSVNGMLYMVCSDISMTNLASIRAIFFGNKLIEDFSLENPYQLVYDNKWTLEKFLSMISAVSSDVDGNGKLDKNDIFGMLCENGPENSNLLHLLTGCDVRSCEVTDDGIQPTIMNDKVLDIMSKIRTATYKTENTITYDAFFSDSGASEFPNPYDYARSFFTTGHFLFVQTGISASDAFKSMTTDFGIVPNPKYDENQENYAHKIDKFAPLLAIPVTNTDLTNTGAILEYMAWKSNETVLPAFYDITMKVKRSRDENMPAMLDIIKKSFSYDLCEIYNIGISDVIWNGYVSENLASEYAKKESVITKNLKKLYDTISELNG